MSKYTYSISVCLWLLLSVAHAQQDKYREPQGTNNWFIEFGGSGLFYSLNYEKLLYKYEKYGMVGRIGAAYNPSAQILLNKITLGDNTFIFPFTTSFVYGGGKERLEAGMGFSLLSQGISQRELIYTAVLGLRVVETNKVYFRISYSPFLRNGEYTHWYGVSLGRNFSTK
jgi:hypothetical protein